jgi:hypothetical protein
MPKTGSASSKGNASGSSRSGEPTSVPAFPYTTRPTALRRFLAEVPKRPKPPKVNQALLGSWGIKGNEASTLIRVLKTLELVAPSNEPTQAYTEFMRAGSGPAVLAEKIRKVYAPLFDASLEPHKDQPDALRNLFNIHSGGAKTTMDYQIQTFKALSEYADLARTNAPGGDAGEKTGVGERGTKHGTPAPQNASGASMHLDLHIHLPENKSSRDYQYIIQDIARFIYGREDTERSDNGREA